MGLFSGDQKVGVASTVYNLAGDETTRPNFLKTTVIGAAMNPNADSIGSQLTTTYLNGPGVKLRGYSRWAQSSGYDTAIGDTESSILVTGNLDTSTLAQLVPHASDATVNIQSAVIGSADYTYWVDRYMVNHHPDLLNTKYVSNFDATTLLVTVTLADGSVETFTATTFDRTKLYLYATFTVTSADGTRSTLKDLIYAQGSGNAGYDGLFGVSNAQGYFFPYIPIRTNTTFLSDSYLPDIYAFAQRAYKKATGAKLDDLITKISQNSSIGDINYAYVVFGVSLNVKENACKQYIYQFFQQIMLGLSLSDSNYKAWLTAWLAADATIQTWNAWYAAQGDTSNPLNGTPEPTKGTYPQAPSYSLHITSASMPVLNYDYTIKWSGIAETTGVGLKKPDANPGDLWFETIALTDQPSYFYVDATNPKVTSDMSTNHVRLNWQVDSQRWRSLDIYDLAYLNMIYAGNAVGIPAPDALASATESGFIIPLNEQIFRKMSIVQSTQMATACCFLVLNSYKVVTAPWYTSGAFKVVLVAAAIVIGVATAGIGDIGILGSSVALGSSLGFTGLAATIVGSVANAVAAILLVQIVQAGAVSIFGDKLGTLIGAIAGIIALQVGTSMMAGGSLFSAFDSLLRVDNLIKLTDALGKGIAGLMQANAQDIMSKTNQLETDYNAQSAQISSKYDDLIGYDHGLVDPLSLTDASAPSAAVPTENPRSFFERTLMVGSDIADLSMSMIANFTDIMLNTEVNLS